MLANAFLLARSGHGGRLKISAQRKVEVHALDELLALHAKHCSACRVDRDLLLLNHAQVC
jgi:hypothetical protein